MGYPIKICVACIFIFLQPPFTHPLSLLVDGGERAVIFDRFRGVLPLVVGEGTHFLIPWVQRPIIFGVRSKPRRIPVVTGSKGQFNISHVLFQQQYPLHYHSHTYTF